MNLANKLTLLRIAMVPVFVASFFLPVAGWNYIAAAIFVLAYITDILDGHYARKYGKVTDFGKLLDPIADKLLTTSALVMLVWWGRLSPIIAIIIIGRELMISGFRLIALDKGKVIAASVLGKIKTVSQCVAIVLVLMENPIFSIIGLPMDQIFVYLSTAITIWSGVDYIYKNRKLIKAF